MKNLPCSETLLLIATPFITGFVIAIPSAHAATFGLSEADVSFTNFNLTPQSVAVITATDTSAIAVDGPVTAQSQADASFSSTPPVATNQTLSNVFGSGLDYTGIASSQAQVIGSFFLTGTQNDNLFSFNFTADLNLQAAVDQPSTESTIANGKIKFVLFGGQDPNQLSPLDFFVLTGKVNTAGANDFLTTKQSQSITVSSKSVNTTFGSSEESAIALIQGLYSRTFDQPTYLTLVETTSNSVTATANAAGVPEPSSILAIALSGIAGCLLKRRSQANINNF